MELIALETSQNWFIEFYVGHQIADRTIETAIFILFIIELAEFAYKGHLMLIFAEGGLNVKFFAITTLAEHLRQ